MTAGWRTVGASMLSESGGDALEGGVFLLGVGLGVAEVVGVGVAT